MFLAESVSRRYRSTRHIAPSVEKWRLKHPHDMPPYRFMPSPTFGHSSVEQRPSTSHDVSSFLLWCVSAWHQPEPLDSAAINACATKSCYEPMSVKIGDGARGSKLGGTSLLNMFRVPPGVASMRSK